MCEFVISIKLLRVEECALISGKGRACLSVVFLWEIVLIFCVLGSAYSGVLVLLSVLYPWDTD